MKCHRQTTNHLTQLTQHLFFQRQRVTSEAAAGASEASVFICNEVAPLIIPLINWKRFTVNLSCSIWQERRTQTSKVLTNLLTFLSNNQYIYIFIYMPKCSQPFLQFSVELSPTKINNRYVNYTQQSLLLNIHTVL